MIDSAFVNSSTTTSQSSRVSFGSSEYPGTAQDPYLTVTYTQSATIAVTTTAGNEIFYKYDSSGQRVKKDGNGIATLYPFKHYEKKGNTITKYLYAGDNIIATIETNNGVEYIHSDHLGSTSVVTDNKGLVSIVMDYYPYGEKKIEEGANSKNKQFIGQYFDENTELNYLNARYYDGGRGRFLGQDPVHLAIGEHSRIERLTGNSQQILLSDPQILNSYGWARGNPINRSDPTGLFNIKTGAVEKGDTLGAITSLLNKTYGTTYSISTVATLNNISNANKIYVGQTIIPNASLPDVTRSLSTANQLHGAETKGPAITFSTDSISTPAVTGIGTIGFANNFRPGGQWDLKSQHGVFCQRSSCGGQTAENYVFNAQIIRGDAPGNIHYGYVGKEAGYSLGTLLFFGDVVQTATHPGQFGDPASDKLFIRQGYGLSY